MELQIVEACLLGGRDPARQEILNPYREHTTSYLAKHLQLSEFFIRRQV